MNEPPPREQTLYGPTYRLTFPEGVIAAPRAVDLLVTVNENEGEPVEIFIQCDDPTLYQWTALISVFMTRLLRDGHPLEKLAGEMLEIHCPHTGHIIPGTAEWVPSLIARIGRALKQHREKQHDKNDSDTEGDD